MSRPRGTRAHAVARRPVLIGCSHGTRDQSGRETIHALLAAVADARPDLDVREAFVDVQLPEVATVVEQAVAEARAGAEPDVTPDGTHAPPVPVVVVPLLLSGGFHVHVDIAASVRDHPAVAADPLGPDPRLVELLDVRITESGADDYDAIIVAAAGSSDPRAAAAVEEVAGALAQRRRGPVTVGYGAGCEPTVPDAVSAARAASTTGTGVVIASYLLAPGHFHDRLLEAGADRVTAPLGADPRVVEIVIDRFTQALTVVGLPT